MALYRWPTDPPGKKAAHTIPYAQHQKNLGKRQVTLARPPAGSYDVDLDAQERASTRGIQNTREDYDTATGRASTDFGLSEADLNREYGENLSDLIKQRTQGQEDYTTNLQTIARNFQRLGNTQAQQGRRAGLGGGFQAQAQRKRQANEALERAPVDTNFNRFMADSAQSETRLGEARARGAGQLGLGYQRGSEDLSTNLSRAENEYTSFGQDVAAARQAQYGGKLPTAWVGGGTPKAPSAFGQGIVDYYNKANPTAPYGSAAFKAKSAFAASQARARNASARAAARAKKKGRK